MLASASKSALHIVFGNTVGKVLNFVSLFLCTSYLGPDGFGSLLIVTIIAGFFNVFLDVGFEHFYLIKVKITGSDQSTDDELNQIENLVFRWRLVSNLILFSLQLGISIVLLGTYFNKPVNYLLQILSLNYLFAIAGRINEIRLRKRLAFKEINRARILGDFIGSITKVALVVWAGLGIIGWTWGVVAGTFVQSIVLASFGRFTPSFVSISRSLQSEARWFMKHSWVAGFGIYLNQQFSNIVLKAMYPLTSIGYYQFSYNYSIDIQTNLTSPQGQLLVSYFSNHGQDPTKLSAVISKAMSTFTLLLLPAIVLGILFTQEFTAFFFGDKWLPAILTLKIFLIYCAVKLLISPTLGLLAGLGKMRENTMVTYGSLILLVVAIGICYLLKVDLFIYALVYCLVLTITDFAKGFLGMKEARVEYLPIFKDQWSLLLSYFIFFAVACVLKIAQPAINLSLLIGLLVFLWLSFYVALFLTGNKQLKYHWNNLQSFLRK